MLWDNQIYHLKINNFYPYHIKLFKRFIKFVTSVTRYKYFICKLINDMKWLKPLINKTQCIIDVNV